MSPFHDMRRPNERDINHQMVNALDTLPDSELPQVGANALEPSRNPLRQGDVRSSMAYVYVIAVLLGIAIGSAPWWMRTLLP